MCHACGQHVEVFDRLCLYCFGDRTQSVWEHQSAAMGAGTSSPPPIPHSVERIVVTPSPSWWAAMTSPYIGMLRRYSRLLGNGQMS